MAFAWKPERKCKIWMRRNKELEEGCYLWRCGFSTYTVKLFDWCSFVLLSHLSKGK
uniref:Uncharacterized protein n=1 Tax=Amphimedon queenslandica TaxID=400682 RepID=A0A1X7TAY5_AMPQE